MRAIGESPGNYSPPPGGLDYFLAKEYKQPNMKVEKTGYGAGNKQFPTWPNVVRVWLGEETAGVSDDGLVLLETTSTT